MHPIRTQTIYHPVCNTSACGIWVDSDIVPSGDSDEKTNDNSVAPLRGLREERGSLISGQRVQ